MDRVHITQPRSLSSLPMEKIEEELGALGLIDSGDSTESKEI